MWTNVDDQLVAGEHDLAAIVLVGRRSGQKYQASLLDGGYIDSVKDVFLKVTSFGPERRTFAEAQKDLDDILSDEDIKVPVAQVIRDKVLYQDLMDFEGYWKSKVKDPAV